MHIEIGTVLTLYIVWVPVGQQESVVKGGQLAVIVVIPKHSKFKQVFGLKVQVSEDGLVTVVRCVGQLRGSIAVVVRVTVEP